ncbi:SGNH/GDSL hydrolase family protein [Tunturiibacter empetritectus]|uniref:Lysophospholipase L1-like esterase n=2 Tax=Tunturiibacter TaxID=3154218 RepID=A0A852VI75_9BACT|nr:SGNH/GDSL hydrolase family protein [Edaphobacter lichenicola]NYF89212.1 lysophospholipase L1-like esterase [Edaphobacter lichenicola]
MWIYKIVLGPLLLAQGRTMRRTARRLAEAAGERTGVILAEGNQSELKLLFVGDSTMAGVGVQNQKAALAFQIAAILAKELGRSVRWQLIAKSGLNTSQAFEFVREQELLPADVIVTALGVNDVTSQRTSRQFVEDYEILIHELLRRTGAQFAVINGLPPLHLTPAAPQPLRWYLGRCAHLLDVHLRQWIAPQRNIAYVSLQWASNPKEMAADGFHPGESQYRQWADLVAETIINLMPKQTLENQAAR